MSSQRLSGGYISLLLPAGRGEEKRGGEWRIDLSWRKKKFFFEEREDGGKRAECEHFFPLSRRKIYYFARRECSSFLSSLNKAEENLAGWIRPGNETTMHFFVLSPWSSGGSSLHGRIPFLQKGKNPSELRYRACRKEKGIPGILRCCSHRNIGHIFSAKVDVEIKFPFCIL